MVAKYSGGASRLSPIFCAGVPAQRPAHFWRWRPANVEQALTAQELAAARAVVVRVLEEVPADLEEAALFGSKARGCARRDSDVDVLLVFQSLPPGREPQAGQAEAIARQVAGATQVPVTVWSVSLIDLRPGLRTPMLVDALDDALPLWTLHEPLAPVTFTPIDALRCVGALLDRVAEGSWEFSWDLAHGDPSAACRRARDDVVRLGTAILLARGITRPRRAEVVDALIASGVLEGAEAGFPVGVLEWVRESFGGDGRDEHLPIRPPPGGLPALTATVDLLRPRVTLAVERLRYLIATGPPPGLPSSQMGAPLLHLSACMHRVPATSIRRAS